MKLDNQKGGNSPKRMEARRQSKQASKKLENVSPVKQRRWRLQILELEDKGKMESLIAKLKGYREEEQFDSKMKSNRVAGSLSIPKSSQEGSSSIKSYSIFMHIIYY